MTPLRRKTVHPDDVRMTFGEHLEELRTYLIRALIGIVLGAIVCWILKGYLLGFITRPVLVVLKANGLETTMMSLAPADGFLVALKLSVLTGVVLASPWVLYQIWRFIGVGLYAHEQRFIKMFLPASVVLFYAGVAFLFFIVLPIVIQFFVSFSLNWPMGNTEPTFIERLILGIQTESTTQPATQPATQPTTQPEDAATAESAGKSLPLRVPILSEFPDAPETGDFWFDAKTNELFLKTEDELFTTTFRKHTGSSALTNQFSIKEYTSFVLLLSLAFGIAFQTPIVVLFLAITKIASVQSMARSRRYVVFGTVIVGAVLTPPDVISQVMLAIPIWFLFEGGLIAARILVKPDSDASDPA